MSDHILIAKIVKAHGIKGDVKVTVYSGKQSNLKNYKNLFFKNDEKIEISSFREFPNYLICKFKNISDRNEAEKLVNKEIFIDKSELPPTQEDEFYYNDLLGLNIYEDNEITGKISYIYTENDFDLIEIAFNDGKKSAYTFNKENFPTIDLEKSFVAFNRKGKSEDEEE